MTFWGCLFTYVMSVYTPQTYAFTDSKPALPLSTTRNVNRKTPVDIEPQWRLCILHKKSLTISFLQIWNIIKYWYVDIHPRGAFFRIGLRNRRDNGKVSVAWHGKCNKPSWIPALCHVYNETFVILIHWYAFCSSALFCLPKKWLVGDLFSRWVKLLLCVGFFLAFRLPQCAQNEMVFKLCYQG